MKKLLFALFLLFFSCSIAYALPIDLNGYVGYDSTSGVSSTASGTSIIYLSPAGRARTDLGNERISLGDIGTCISTQMFPTGVSEVADDEKKDGGNNDSSTFTIYAEHSLDRTFTNVEKIYFLKNMTLSGNSRYVRKRIVPSVGYSRFILESGDTAFQFGWDDPQIHIVSDENTECRESSPIYEMTVYPMNANSGISTHTVSNGTRYVVIQYSGDNVSSIRHDGVAVSGSDGGFNIGSGYLGGEIIEGATSISMNAESSVSVWVTEAF